MVKTFLLSLAPTRNGVYRTCLLTPSATDTFRTVGVFHRVDHHLASLCTFSTVNAFFHIYTVAVNGNLIEYGIKCAKRTNITAKWSVNNNGKNNCHDQNCIFPYVQPANGTAHSLVQKYEFSLEKESYSAGPGSDQRDRENHTPAFPGSHLRKSEIRLRSRQI